MTRFVLPDVESVADLATFTGRAHAVAPSGSVRLAASGDVLACYAGILDGSGLFGEGVVLGLRVLRLAAPCDPVDADVTVPSERLLTLLGEGAVVEVDGDPLPPRWTGQSPPRGGWEQVAELDAATLHEAARSQDVRAPVEGMPPGVTHGVALALRALGLLVCDPVLYRSGPWSRLSTPAGHVLTR